VIFDNGKPEIDTTINTFPADIPEEIDVTPSQPVIDSTTETIPTNSTESMGTTSNSTNESTVTSRIAKWFAVDF